MLIRFSRGYRSAPFFKAEQASAEQHRIRNMIIAVDGFLFHSRTSVRLHSALANLMRFTSAKCKRAEGRPLNSGFLRPLPRYFRIPN